MGNLIELSKQLRLSALEMAYRSGKNGAHLGGGLSTVEIFATLYGKVLRFDIQNKEDENRDRLVVSKGHCVLSYYSALHESGFLTDEDIASFETNGSHFHGHAMRNLQKGIEFSGGSLSMGMSFAVGQALACKKKGLNNRIFVIVGDGECDEGLVWEAAMSAANYNLNNLVLIVDKNNLQYDGLTAEVMNQIDLGEKFRVFGFDVRVVDGHNCDALTTALDAPSEIPICVIAETIKGKGVSFMEGEKMWHHGTLNEEQFNQARKEVESV
jgi:transketolase